MGCGSGQQRNPQKKLTLHLTTLSHYNMIKVCASLHKKVNLHMHKKVNLHMHKTVNLHIFDMFANTS